MLSPFFVNEKEVVGIASGGILSLRVCHPATPSAQAACEAFVSKKWDLCASESQ